MKHAWFAASVACKITLLLSALVLTAHPAQADEWLKYEADHLTVYSDCPPYRAKSLIRQFAAFQYAARTLMVPPKSPFPHTTLVFFNDKSEFEKYYRPTKQEYYTTEILYGWKTIGRNRLIATAADRNLDERVQAMYRLEAGALLQWYDATAPQWLRHMAELAFTGLNPRRNTIEFSGPTPEQRKNLTKIPWRDWVVVCGADDVKAESETKPTNIVQAQRWLLAKWMLFDSSPQGSAFMNMLEAMRMDRTKETAAFETGLGMNEAQLTNRLRVYFQEYNSNGTLAFASDAFESRLRITQATQQEIHIVFFYLLSTTHPTESARQQLDQAIASGPETVELMLAQALCAKLENDAPTAIRHYRKAISAGTHDPTAYLGSARGRLRIDKYDISEVFGVKVSESSIISATDAEVQKAIDEILTALRLDLANQAAYSQLAHAITQLSGVNRGQAEILSLGVSEKPAGINIRLARGLAYFRAGALAEAEADFDYLLRAYPDSREARSIIDWRKRQSEAKTQYEANKSIKELFAEKRYAEARQKLVQALADESNITIKRSYEKEIAQLDEMLAWDSIMFLARDQRWSEVEKSAAAYIEAFPKRHRVQVVKNRLRTAQEHLQ